VSNFEILSFIVVDTLSSNLFFIPSSELAVWVVPKLSALSISLLLSLTFIGVLLAHLINYVFGRIIVNILVPVAGNKEVVANIDVLKEIYKKFGYYLLTIAFIPVFGKFVVLIAGFTRFKWFPAVLIATVVKVVFYGVKIFYFL